MGDPSTAPPGPSISVIRPDGSELEHVRLESGPLRVGRDSANDIVLSPDPDQLVSRAHCLIERTGQRWCLRDLDSRNHVFVERGGERARVGRAPLLHGDTVCVRASAVTAPPERYWRLAFSDPGETRFADAMSRLQHYPESGTVWLLGGHTLPRRVEAPPKARRMLLYMLDRHAELGRPDDGIVASLAELKRALWPGDEDPRRRTDSAVANVAWELRSALGDEDQRLLQTIRDEGYRLVPGDVPG